MTEYQIIYKKIECWWSWSKKTIHRILIPIKSYNHEIIISDKIKIYTFLPLRPYMNNSNFRL